MGGGLPEAPHGEEHPADLAVEDDQPGTDDALVDRLLDEGVGDLVGVGAAPLGLGHEPGPDEGLERRPELLQGAVAEDDDVAQLYPPAGHGQDVDDAALAVVELLHADPDPLGQTLGERPQRRPGEVSALFDEGLEEPEDEQRVALGPGAEPVDQLRLGDGPDDLLGQLPDGVGGQRPISTRWRAPVCSRSSRTRWATGCSTSSPGRAEATTRIRSVDRLPAR